MTIVRLILTTFVKRNELTHLYFIRSKDQSNEYIIELFNPKDWSNDICVSVCQDLRYRQKRLYRLQRISTRHRRDIRRHGRGEAQVGLQVRLIEPKI